MILAVTGYGRGEDIHRAQEAGCDYHLLKPVDPQLLQRLLDGYRRLRELKPIPGLGSLLTQTKKAPCLDGPIPEPKIPVQVSESGNGTHKSPS